MKKCLTLAVFALATSVLFGYEASVDNFVANSGQRIAVPVRFDTVCGASHVGVRVAYDPQVLVLVKAEEGDLTATLDDDFIVVGDAQGGAVSVSAFGTENVAAEVGGTLATLIFEVREGTQGLYSDVAVSDVRVGEKTGVKDITVGNAVTARSGMVRVVGESAAVERLGDNAQIICADVRCGSLVLRSGDAIQASGSQTAIAVSEAVSSEGTVRVLPPITGWSRGKYAILSTTTAGLQLALEGLNGATATCGFETEGGITTYTVEIATGEVPVVCEGETLAAEDRNRIRKAIVDAGRMPEGVKGIAVAGPSGNVGLIADLGIAPAVGAVDANGILNVTYSMPTITITSFDPKSGVVGIKVVPGTGNAIVSTIATGYVHVYGSSTLGEEMQRLETLEFDLTPYLKTETRGEAALTVDLGTHSFLRVKVAP